MAQIGRAPDELLRYSFDGRPELVMDELLSFPKTESQPSGPMVTSAATSRISASLKTPLGEAPPPRQRRKNGAQWGHIALS